MKSPIEVGGACGKNERGPSTSDGNTVHQQGESRKIALEMVILHREGHQ